MHWRTWGSMALLPLITIVGLAVRLITLGDRSLWSDELFALNAAHLDLQQLFLPRLIDNGNMLLFYVAAHFWVGLLPAMPPVDETLIRLLPLSFSVATIPALYLLAKRTAQEVAPQRSGHIIGAIAAAFYALNPLAVTYAQEFRGYSLQLLLLTLSSLTLMSALSGTSRAARWWVAYALLAALSLYAHLLASLMIGSQLLVVALLVLSKRAPKPRIDHLIIAGATFGALASPLVLTVIRQGSGQIGWMLPITFQAIQLTLLLLMGSSPAGPISLAHTLSAFIVIGVVGYGFIRLVRSPSRWQTSSLLLISAVLVPPMLSALFSLLIQPIWLDRYLQFLLLPVAQLFAFGLAALWDLRIGIGRLSLPPQRIRFGAVISILALLFTITSLRFTLARMPNEDWPALAQATQKFCSADQTKRVALTVAPRFIEANLYFYEINIDETIRVDKKKASPDLPSTEAGESLCLISHWANLSDAALGQYLQQLEAQVGPMTVIPDMRGFELYYFQAAQP
jgi:uncharacterized membrane protein